MRQVHSMSLQVIRSQLICVQHFVKDLLIHWFTSVNGVRSSNIKGEGRPSAPPALNWKSARLVGARREAALQMEWPGFGERGKFKWGPGPFKVWSPEPVDGPTNAWLELALQRLHSPRVRWWGSDENSHLEFPATAPALQDINILYFSPFFSHFLGFVCATVMELTQALFHFDPISRSALNSLSPSEACGVFIVPVDFYRCTIVLKITCPKCSWKIISKFISSKFWLTIPILISLTAHVNESSGKCVSGFEW